MADTETVTIAGHTYVVGKSGIGRQMRLARILGPELSKNDAYMTAARVCDAIESIDGVPVPKMSTPEQFEKMADQLDDAVPELVKALKRTSGLPEDDGEGVEIAKN